MSFGTAMGVLGAAEFFLNINARGALDALKQVQGEIKKTTDEMAKDLDKGAKEGGDALEKLRNPIGAATEKLTDFAKAIGITVPQMAALGAIAGIVIKAGLDLADAYKEAAKEANNLAQETQKLELITRTTAESASAFLGLLERYDISAGTANRSFITLQKSIKDYNEAIATGTAGGAGAEAIGKLGIALTDANGQAVKTEEVFLRVANSLRNMKDPVEANTIGTTLLGRGYTTLAGMIGDTDEELRHFLEDALKSVSITSAQEKAIIGLHQSEKTLEEMQKGVNIQLALMGQPIHQEMIEAQIQLWRVWLGIMQAMRPVIQEIQRMLLDWKTTEIEKIVFWTEKWNASLEMANAQLAKLRELSSRPLFGENGLIGGPPLSPEVQEQLDRARGREEMAKTPESARLGPKEVPHAAEGAAGEIAKAAQDYAAFRKTVADYNIQENKRETEEIIANHERHVKALEVQHDKDVENEDLRHDQRMRHIEDQERADETAHNAEVNRLEVAMDAELDAAERTHNANIAAINAELERERDLHDARVATAQLAKRGEERGAEERRDTGLEAEKQAIEEREEARRQADFQRGQDEAKADNAAKDYHNTRLKEIKDHKEQEQERIRDKIEALDDDHEKATRRIAAETKLEQTAHEGRLEDLRVEREAADDVHEDAVEALEDEAEAARDTAQARIEGVQSASDALRDQADAQIEGIRDASEALREQTEEQIEGIRDASEALREQHEEQVEAIRDEMEALREKYDEQTDAIRDQQQAERQAARERMAAIDEETAKRRAAIEEQLGLLDQERQADREAAQDRADQERLQAATEKLTTALGAGGDPADILAAQQDVADAQYQIQQHANERGRQSQEDALEAQLKAIEDAAEAEKAAIEAEQEMKDAAHAAELERLEDELEAAIDLSEDKIDLLEDQLDAALKINEQQIELLEDQLDAALKVNDRQIELIEKELDRALDANEQKIAAIEEERDRRLASIDEQREVLDDDHERTIDLIDDKVRAENTAFKKYQDVQAGRRQELDDTYTDAKELLEEQVKLEDKTAEDATEREKQRYEDERREVKTTRDLAAEQLRIARAQEDANTALSIALIKDQYEKERLQIWETYDNPESGLFKKLDVAWTETQRTIALRLKDENAHYDAVKEQIKKTYTSTDPNAMGLIPLQEAAYQAIVEGHRKSKQDEEDYHGEVRKKIEKTYYDKDDPDNPKGLITAQQKAIENLKKDLTDVIANWTKWQQDVTAEIQKVIDAYNRLRDANRDANMPGGARVPSGGGGGGGAAFPVPPPFDDAHHVVVYNALLPNLTGFTTAGTHGGYPAADIFAKKGENIHAPVSGISNPAVYSAGGNTTTIEGDDKTSYYMAHGDRAFKSGRVTGGEIIGAVGDTGNAKGTHPHLHFAIATNSGVFGQRNGSGDINGDTRWYSFSSAPEMPGGGSGRNPNAGREEIRTFIAAEASERGIDPGIAVRVVAGTNGKGGEGGLEPMRVGIFNTGRSFWPFQLHYGGAGTPYAAWGTKAGMGNDFTPKSGLQPGDPSAWGPSTEYALDVAKRQGWGPPGGWYGAHVQDITGFMGIGRGSVYAEGGLIQEPTLLVNAQSLKPYGMMAEQGPEYIVPQAQMLANDPGKLSGAGGFGWFANGGRIDTPSLLVDTRSMQPYGMMAEAGPEYIVPEGAFGGGDTPRDLVGAGAPAVNYHFDVRGPSMNQVAHQIRRQFERSEWLHRGWR